MKPIIISAPFGNYLSSYHATSTVGTYTLKNRAGFLRWWLFWRMIRTLRWRPGMGGWTNKLGLPNPGIQHAISKADRNRSWANDKIVSIHGLEPNDWGQLLHDVRWLDPAAVELNVSCPNIGHLSVPENLFRDALNLQTDIAGVPTTVPVIVKLPPVNYWDTFKLAVDSGVKTFHCCNTLPVPAGGLSGKALKRVSLDVVKRIKDAHPEVTVIGGGGITTPVDVVDYKKAGASHFAVASAFLNPIRYFRRESFLTALEWAAGAHV